MSAKPVVYLYLPCSQTKQLEVSHGLKLGSVKKNINGESAVDCVTRWTSMVDSAMTSADRKLSPPVPKKPAIELYLGGFWKEARELMAETVARDVDIHLRIVSAGLGLIDIDTEVPGYDATFSPGSFNSIPSKAKHDQATRNREWWSELCKWKRFPSPRSFRSAVIHVPGAAHVVALPQIYLEAVEEDLRDACSILSRRKSGSLIILTTPYTKQHGVLAGTVEIPGDFYSKLKGTRGTVLQRAALRGVRELGQKASQHSAWVDWLSRLPGKVVALPVRDRVSEEEIETFINRELDYAFKKKEPMPSLGSLLVKLRASGKACERLRFKRIYGPIADSK